MRVKRHRPVQRCTSGVRLSARRSRLSVLVPSAVGATALTAVLALAGGPAQAAPAAPAVAPSGSVVVLMRDQLSRTPVVKNRMTQRRAAATASQDSVVDQVAAKAGGAPTDVVHYAAANAFSATVTQAQADALAADPSVALVVPNRRISVPVRREASAAGPVTRATVPADTSAICPSDPSKPLLEPEALSDTRTASDDPTAKTAQQLATGRGVKVAYIADGIDPANPDLIRADGSRVITDYQAFSADGPAPEEGGAEAYGDASSIGAQGRVAHDLSDYVNPAYPLPKGCNIRILGMAPGASIVALKIDFFTTSIIQAIDYATSTAKVDVINESFGGNVVPDASTRSAISLFNDAAVKAGITVTVSSGDAGTTSTIGNPATDPQVISVAASTNSRAYAQTGYAGARAFGNGRWVNDQISSLSSGGFTQSGGTVDLAAPGESGWAICGGAECADYRGGTSDIQLFGGTSQSAPLTAGAAALVIEAYRSTHGGASPSPAQVKHLLTSTASDLGLPTFEQGAGLLDARAAVEAALTSPGAKKVPAGLSSNILLDQSQVSLSGAPGSSRTATLKVRNVGTKKLTVAVSTRDLRAFAADEQTTKIDASSPQTFPYPVTGAPWVYKKVSFAVPAGTDRLAAAAIWQGAARQVGTTTVTPVVRVSLFAPDGTYVANSRPQGGAVSANYANLDVRKPVAGTWTAVLYTLAGASGYTGDVTLQTTAERAVRVGSVNQPTLKLKPGQRKTVKVRLTLPTDAGDTARAITLASSDGHRTVVPVVQRAVVPVSKGAGSFRGTITGGNARSGSAAQVFTYAFDVPKGTPDLGAGVTLADDAGIQLEGVLVDPNDETQSIGSNAYSSADGSSITSQGRTMQLNAADPVPGRWRVIVLVQNPVTGKELGEKFSGTIAFGRAKVAAVGVPTSTATSLPQGQATTAQVTVTNTGIAPVNVQLDPRTDAVRSRPLTSPFGSQDFQLPDHGAPTFLVPPGTTSLTATAVSDVPAVVDLLPGAQGIEVVGGLQAGKKGSTVSSATVKEKPGTVSTGIWYTDVNEIGPVGPSGPPTADSQVDLTARTPDFDTAVTSSTGDFWPVVLDPQADIGTPVTIQPGGSATVTVSIKPTGKVGSTVHGVLNVIVPPSFAYPNFNTTGDVITSLGYAYTVGAPSAAVPDTATAGR